MNLTDGLDGLARDGIIALFTLTAMAVTIYIRSAAPNGGRIENRLDAAFIGAALIGAAIGFLWFNAFPAEVFMGDTGSMALGARSPRWRSSSRSSSCCCSSAASS